MRKLRGALLFCRIRVEFVSLLEDGLAPSRRALQNTTEEQALGFEGGLAGPDR